MHEPPPTDSSPPRRTPAVDQRLWPTVALLVIWAGVVGAVIVAAGGFDDPRPWCNAWVRLLTVVATLAALIWAVVTIYPQRARRLKMAVVVSLAAHTLLAAVLHESRLEFHAVALPQQSATATRDDGPKEVVLPEYVRDPERQRRRQEEFERPVATGRPMATSSALARRRAQLGKLANTNWPSVAISTATPPTVPRPQLRRRTIVTSPDASSTPVPTAGRRRAIATAVLPHAAVTIPQPAAERIAIAPEPVADAPATLPMARADRMRTTPLLSQAAAPSVVRSVDRPAARLSPRRTQVNLDRSASDESAMPAREPRLAMLPRFGLGIARSSTTEPLPGVRRTAPAFANRLRSSQQKNDIRRQPGRSPSETDAAIAGGLEFLAGIQRDDGRWEFDYLGSAVAAGAEPVIIDADAAATGLALLAFLGVGHDHLDGRYRRVVQDALDYLVRIQNEEGALFPEEGQWQGQVTRFYGHGIATLALTEAYGMTGDPKLYQPAQRAIDYLVATQHADRGGWRYVPGSNTDLSVTGWQLMALRSGRSARLTVPPETIDRIRQCLERCRDVQNGGALFRYNPWASPTDPTTRHGREPSTVMTSVGLLMQLLLDGDTGDERVRAGAEHLLVNLPRTSGSPDVAPTGTRGNPERDTYYWYYGTQAMYHLGGDYWEAWRERLEPLLVRSQIASGPLAGSWDPLRPVPDKWAAYGGRLYVTALNLLSLEADYRHLPLDDPATPRVADRP